MTDAELAPERRVPASTRFGIDLVKTEPDARRTAQVLADIWGHRAGHVPIPPELVWAMAHAGNYVAVARVDGQIVGASLGLRGADDQGPLLHSHMTGVLPECRGLAVGVGLKQHQRDWALAADLGRITWTFDPLVARNAAFNLNKLGARLASYHSDFYGELSDGINGGDRSDRCFVVWDLRSGPAAPGAQDWPLVALSRDVDEAPRLIANGYGDARLLRVEIPADIVAMRASAPELAARWRMALRGVLTSALDSGWTVSGFTRDSAYLLARR